MDDRTIRIAVLLSAHIIFLSAGALRIVRGQRGHRVRTGAPWWIQYYPPLVWLPFVLVYTQVAWFAGLLPSVDLGIGTQLAGLTGLVVLPLTFMRVAAEERVLREAFAPYADYARRVPALFPLLGSR